MNTEQSNDNLVWVDLEMSGLDVNKEYILEMACLITDSQLNIIAEGPDIVIHQSDSVLNSMDEWNTIHHGESGLTEQVRKSKILVEETEQIMLDFIQKYTSPGKSPLCGNTVHMDKRFLDKFMPQFTKHLHYRIIDVSTLKELTRRWYPTDFAHAPVKKNAHRALEDIKESIDELKFYKNTVFKE